MSILSSRTQSLKYKKSTKSWTENKFLSIMKVMSQTFVISKYGSCEIQQSKCHKSKVQTIRLQRYRNLNINQINSFEKAVIFLCQLSISRLNVWLQFTSISLIQGFFLHFYFYLLYHVYNSYICFQIDEMLFFLKTHYGYSIRKRKFLN